MVKKHNSMKLPKGVSLFSLEMVFTQDADSCDPETMGQSLTVSTDDAGGGTFIVIKTDRWAIDKPEDLTKIIQTVNDLHKGCM
jgi:hypothetical protein